MSVLLDVAIGMIVIALVFSIIVSGVNEWVAQAFARRGHFLRLGLQRLVADPAIYARILHHPLIGSMYREAPAAGKPPSYIPSANFARALVDVLLTRASATASPMGRADGAPSLAELRAALSAPALAGSPVGIALRPILDEAGDVQAALKNIATWYESGMDRVSGWYRVRTQKVLFVIGFSVAVLFNVDAIEAVTMLARSAESRAAAVAVAQAAESSGQIGSVRLNELKDRPPTVAEWQSLYPVLEGLRAAGSAALPVGYSCLGRIVAADLGAAARFTPGAAEAGAPPGTDASGSAPGPWRACAQELRAFAATQPVSAWVLKLVGWSLMAFAGTLGAVYWFGLLSTALKLRGSGQKPLPAGS